MAGDKILPQAGNHTREELEAPIQRDNTGNDTGANNGDQTLPQIIPIDEQSTGTFRANRIRARDRARARARQSLRVACFIKAMALFVHIAVIISLKSTPLLGVQHAKTKAMWSFLGFWSLYGFGLIFVGVLLGRRDGRRHVNLAHGLLRNLHLAIWSMTLAGQSL